MAHETQSKGFGNLGVGLPERPRSRHDNAPTRKSTNKTIIPHDFAYWFLVGNTGI